MEMNHEPWKETEPFSFGVPFRSWESGLANFNFPLHWHDYYEIAEVTSGALRISLRGRDFYAPKGSIVTIPQGIVHGFFDTDKPAGIRNFQFLPAIFMEEPGRALIQLKDLDTLFEQNPVVNPDTRAELYHKVIPLLDGLFGEYLSRATGWPLAIRAGVCGLMLAFLRERQNVVSDQDALQEAEKPEAQSMSPDDRMQRVLTLIFDNYGRPGLELDDGARAAYLSPYYFSRFFKKQTGDTFHHYLSMVRISHAEEALAKTDLPVTTLAFDSGFNSLSTFNRLFKAKVGLSPDDYRRKVRNSTEKGKI
jgi:AraC-like DNA-binding protein